MGADASTGIGERSDSRSVTIRATVGYQHYVYTYTCANCGREWLVNFENWNACTLSATGDCSECHATNTFRHQSIQPSLPAVLYIGYDKNRQLELFPVPPDAHSPGYFPYSTRSFIHQASREFVHQVRDWSGCAYDCYPRGETLGEPVFNDVCNDMDQPGFNGRKCHMLSGWTRGENACSLFHAIASLCQTDVEKKFLHQYMSLVKGRNFPMLIPQARVGIAERRRPDFVLFAPNTALRYDWYAIELDGSHEGSDEERDKELKRQGYSVYSVRPGAKGYYEEVQRLLESVEVDMTIVEADPEGPAIKREVRSYEPASF
jgi:hypothetical protein